MVYSIMQPKLNHTICTSFPSPIKLPASLIRQVESNSVQTITARAISISTPDKNNQVNPAALTIPAPETVDDSVAAFWDYQFLFVSQRSETAEAITLRVVDGAVPLDFPSGTYYLTGPGLFSDDHGSTVHPLDGHGYLRAFTFDHTCSKDVKFMAKYIKTEAQVEEHDPVTNTWKFTHRGPFSVLKGGKKVGNTKVMKNVANTSVLRWGGRLMCLWEGGDPYEIQAGSLETVGRLNIMDDDHDHGYCNDDSSNKLDRVKENLAGGAMDVLDVAAEFLKPILYGVFKMPRKRMLSHYKIDSCRNQLITVACNAEDMLLPRSNLTFYEYDSNFKIIQKQEFEVPEHMMIHDWAFTDTHYIIFANRIKLDIFGSMLAVFGTSPMISALSLNPSKPSSPIYLLPRFPNHSGRRERDWRVPIEIPSQIWLLHVANAFHIQDHQHNLEIYIHAASSSYTWFNFQNLFGYNWRSGKLDPSMMNVESDEPLARLVQVAIKLDPDGNCRECNVETLNQWKNCSDFPIINPTFAGQKNKFVYAATTSGTRQALPHFPFDSVLKLNLVDKSSQTWSPGKRRFIGEPIFVPKGDHDHDHDDEDEDEEDGYLLVIEYAVSVQRCYLLVLDPKKFGEGDEDALVARLEVPKHLNFPLGFHGFWDPQSKKDV